MKNENCIITEFVSMLGNNIKSIKYNPYNDDWTIDYNNDLKSDVINSEDLIDFLQNG